MNLWIKTLLGLLAGLLLSLVLATVLVLRALKPAPGEWTRSVQLGPWSHEVSVPAVLHIASHPFVLRLIEGRAFKTRYGTVHWEAVAAPNTWRAATACHCTTP